VGSITLTNPVAGTEITAGLHATNYSALQTLLNGNLDNVNISATADLDAVARVGVRKDSAGSTFERRRLNFIQGSGVTLTVADDSGNEEVDITIAASATETSYKKTTEKDVVSTVSETDLLNGEITIGAGVPGTDKMIRVTLLGDYLNNSGAARDLTLKIKFGGTTLWDETITAITATATRRAWRLVFEIGMLGAANSQFFAGVLSGSQGAATTGLGDSVAVAHWSSNNGLSVAFGSNGTHSLDTATSKLLEVTATHSTNNASLSMRLKYALVEVKG
jgi:hypothetical protein